MTPLEPRIAQSEIHRRLQTAEQRRPRACWCGQELDGLESRFCPRCGSACRPGIPVALSLPAV
jgi:hypothetical protein